MRMTIRKESFLLGDLSCPEEFDPLMFRRVTEKYEQLGTDGTPFIEHIFDYVVRQMESDIFKDVLRKVMSEHPSLNEKQAREIADNATASAIDSVIIRLEDEVMDILKHKKLCYFSYSLGSSLDGNSLMSSPQTDPLLFLRSGDLE